MLLLSPIHTADADATKLFCRVGVGGVYWALDALQADCNAEMVVKRDT